MALLIENHQLQVYDPWNNSHLSEIHKHSIYAFGDKSAKEPLQIEFAIKVYMIATTCQKMSPAIHLNH